MALSVCCQWLEPRTKRNGSVVYENSIREKNLQLGFYKNGKYPEQRIRDTYHNNVDNHISLVPKLLSAGIRSFRMSSNLLPLFDYAGDIARNDAELIKKLQHLGQLFINNGIRVTCHPGQFTVISSDSDAVIANSVRELEYHAWVFDSMGLDRTTYYAINIHGGKGGNSDRAIDTILNLPDNVKSRLTLENDERAYNPRELLAISGATGVPVVWDSHHHVFNDGGMNMDDAIRECSATWGDIKPLQHISNTEPGLESGSFTERRKHSFYIHYIPEPQLECIVQNSVDVDVEAKGKNLAVLKMAEDFNLPL